MKKMGIGILSVFILVLGFSVWQSKFAHSYEQKDDMQQFVSQTFAKTGAKQSGYTVHDWSVIDQYYHSEQELYTLGQKLEHVLQIQTPKTFSNENGSRNMYQIRGKWGTATDVSMILTSMKFPGSAPQTTLVIRAENHTSDPTQLSKAIVTMKQAIALTNAKPQISTCIEGFLDDRMDKVERNVLISKTFNAVHATEIEGVRSDLVTSISGYSPMLQDYILTNGKKMNLQMALHYDSVNHKTRVLVGSPIVTIEY